MRHGWAEGKLVFGRWRSRCGEGRAVSVHVLPDRIPRGSARPSLVANEHVLRVPTGREVRGGGIAGTRTRHLTPFVTAISPWSRSPAKPRPLQKTRETIARSGSLSWRRFAPEDSFRRAYSRVGRNRQRGRHQAFGPLSASGRPYVSRYSLGSNESRNFVAASRPLRRSCCF